MRAMQALQPQLKEIQEKYKDDKQRQQQEMMTFYQENGINPLASCFRCCSSSRSSSRSTTCCAATSFQADVDRPSTRR